MTIDRFGPTLHSVRADVPAPDDLCLLPATRLAAMLRAPEVSARELLTAHLTRVDRLNPAVNTLVTLDMEGARAVGNAALSGLGMDDVSQNYLAADPGRRRPSRTCGG